MAARSVWKGYIRFSLVSIPCKAYTATASSSGGVALNQLHKDCGARIKYTKTCPVHGEVPTSEIVSGYEFAKDQYVVIDPDEIETLRSKSDKTLGIEAFISSETIEPRYFTGRTMYLVPDGPIGRKPYAMLHRLMAEEDKVGFCTGVFNNKEQIMLLRPIDKLIGVSFLSYSTEVRSPAEFEPEVGDVDLEKKELDLARTLVNQLTEEDFDFAKYADTYQEKLTQLVQAKVEGKEIVAPPEEEEPQVINLMEALQKSLDDAKAKAKPAKITKPGTAAKKTAAAAKAKTRRKTG